jgi:hypothetical protein
MSAQTIELIARFEGVRHSFGDTIIANARLHPSSKDIAKKCGVADPDGMLTIKGQAKAGSNPARCAGNF